MPRRKEENSIIPVSMNVKKSNVLIKAIGNPSLLANKLLFFSLMKVKEVHGCTPDQQEMYTRIRKRTGVDFTQGLVAEMDNLEFRKLIGDKTGSYYARMAELMSPQSPHSLIRQWGVVVNDPKSKICGFVAIITAMIYDDTTGKLFVKFSAEQDIQDQIYDIKKGYTLLNSSIMMTFKSSYAYRLYEILCSSIGMYDYKIGHQSNAYSFEYGVSELKYRLGALKSTSDQETEALASAVSIADYEQIEEKYSAKVRSAQFSYFDKQLKKAIAEINAIDKAEYIIDYSRKSNRRGGKITSLIFTIQRTNALAPEEIPDETDTSDAASSGNELDETKIYDAIDEMRSFIKEKIKTKDLMEIGRAADFDIMRIRKAYEVACSSPTKIQNLVGFMISAIKEDFSAPVSKTASPKTHATGFSNFKQRDDDLNAAVLEKLKDIL